MKSGLYVTVSFEAAIPPPTLEHLGFHPRTSEASLQFRSPACAIGLADSEPAALDLWQTPTEVCGLAGYLDEPAALAASLGLSTATQPAQLATAALQRFGADAAHHMLGEWELVHWRPHPAQLTLLSSRARRDPVYFRLIGSTLCVSPEPLALCRLSGRPELDPMLFALHCSRYGLRRILADQTIWKAVLQLTPGTREIFTLDHRQTTQARDTDALSPGTGDWTGSFEDAIERLECIGRRVLGQHLDRHRKLAFQLSGGQDSTLLTCWGALAAREPGRPAAENLVCLCSAASPGSDLRDESAVSHAAAAQLGLPWQLVVPPAEWNLYRPRPEAFAFSAHPMVAETQPATRALQQAARAAGTGAMVSGAFGEITLTGGEHNPAGRSWLRNRREELRGWTRRLMEIGSSKPAWPQDAFLVRFTPEILAAIPQPWQAAWQTGAPPHTDGQPGQPIGTGPQLRKTVWESTAVAPGLRLILPFRDRRLVEAVAVLPTDYRWHNGLTRSLSRALLRGHVPEAVRLRTEKMPFAPDFRPRMQQQAPEALNRLPDLADAGVGRWIDLAWMHAQLTRCAAGHLTGYDDLYQLQRSAAAAEFLFWLKAEA